MVDHGSLIWSIQILDVCRLDPGIWQQFPATDSHHQLETNTLEDQQAKARDCIQIWQTHPWAWWIHIQDPFKKRLRCQKNSAVNDSIYLVEYQVTLGDKIWNHPYCWFIEHTNIYIHQLHLYTFGCRSKQVTQAAHIPNMKRIVFVRMRIYAFCVVWYWPIPTSTWGPKIISISYLVN